MRVLLSTHHLVKPGGTESLTATVAEGLTRSGIEVTIYCPLVRQEFLCANEIRVPVVTSIDQLGGKEFDLAHVNHNLNAIEIRARFPALPMIWVANGVIPFLEQPSPLPLGISRCLAVSEEVRDHVLAAGTDFGVSVWRNPVSEQRFQPVTPARERPRSALILSSGMSVEREEMIRDACAARAIACRFAGRGFEWITQSDLPGVINEVDIVFGRGRRAVEAMLCGRAAVVLDDADGDGIVSAANFADLMTHNFSGRRLKRSFDSISLGAELDRYDLRASPALRELAIKHFGAGGRLADLLGHYDQTLKQTPAVAARETAALVFVAGAIAETRFYSRHNPLPRRLVAKPTRAEQPSLAEAGLRRLLRAVDAAAPPGSRRGTILSAVRDGLRRLIRA